jgi:hypothetical protein
MDRIKITMIALIRMPIDILRNIYKSLLVRRAYKYTMLRRNRSIRMPSLVGTGFYCGNSEYLKKLYRNGKFGHGIAGA